MKQMRKLHCWVRASEALDSRYFVGGAPDVASVITGYEII
jgi:hypothetical protein